VWKASWSEADGVGAVFDNKEGERIAKLVGNKKIAILQNHGVLSLGKLAIDEAAWWYVFSIFTLSCLAEQD
jgi:hypothetical protein